MEYIATFFTHSGAMKFRRLLSMEKIDVELRPVPRVLSSSCGIAGTFRYCGDLSQLISEDLEKVFRIAEEGYELIYENE